MRVVLEMETNCTWVSLELPWEEAVVPGFVCTVSGAKCRLEPIALLT